MLGQPGSAGRLCTAAAAVDRCHGWPWPDTPGRLPVPGNCKAQCQWEGSSFGRPSSGRARDVRIPYEAPLIAGWKHFSRRRGLTVKADDAEKAPASRSSKGACQDSACREGCAGAGRRTDSRPEGLEHGPGWATRADDSLHRPNEFGTA